MTDDRSTRPTDPTTDKILATGLSTINEQTPQLIRKMDFVHTIVGYYARCRPTCECLGMRACECLSACAMMCGGMCE